MKTLKKVRIIEVGPRDGLQNEKKIISTEDKFEFIHRLIQSGVNELEVSSFVRSEKIPQMNDAAQLSDLISQKKIQANRFIYLVPNLKGLEIAINHRVKNIAIFTATSDSFNKKNINATIEESFERLKDVSTRSIAEKIEIRGYVSTVFGCPYEKDKDDLTKLTKLKYVCDKLFKLGCYEVSLGDTIGIAHPAQVDYFLDELKKDFDIDKLAMHFHDTEGKALANIHASIKNGVNAFDSSVGGIGGCPYAIGSTGNVATEDVVHMLHQMGYVTGIDLSKLCEASQFIYKKLGSNNYQSKMLIKHINSQNMDKQSC